MSILYFLPFLGIKNNRKNQWRVTDTKMNGPWAFPENCLVILLSLSGLRLRRNLEFKKIHKISYMIKLDCLMQNTQNFQKNLPILLHIAVPVTSNEKTCCVKKWMVFKRCLSSISSHLKIFVLQIHWKDKILERKFRM